MLDFELSEAKKEDINLHNILSGRDVKVNNSLGRLALSKGVCRFELPMDMKLLECMLIILFPKKLPYLFFLFLHSYESYLLFNALL